MSIPLDRATFVRPVAHRGLHDHERCVVENSAGAFRAAIAKNYAIECDLRPARGGEPVVFHDDTLERLMEARGPVAAHSVQGLKRFRYKLADEAILSFAEFLELTNSAVPLMVELKNEWEAPDFTFLEQVAKLAQTYKGPIVLKAFDPALMAALRHLAPKIPRGIVAGKYTTDGWWSDRLGPWRRFGLSNLLYSGAVRPSFISYHLNDLPRFATSTARSVFNLPLFAWTVRTKSDHARAAQLADAPIFEGYEP